MPTIRIDQEVFEGLQKLGKPFVDTPSSVIEKLLVEKGVLSPKSHPHAPHPAERKAMPRARTGTVTRQPVYEDWLQIILWKKFNGSGYKTDVAEVVVEAMKRNGILGKVDFELISSGEVRAVNTTAWARNALKGRGMIKKDSPRGIWELTERGKQQAKILFGQFTKNGMRF